MISLDQEFCQYLRIELKILLNQNLNAFSILYYILKIITFLDFSVLDLSFFSYAASSVKALYSSSYSSSLLFFIFSYFITIFFFLGFFNLFANFNTSIIAKCKDNQVK